MSSTCTKYAQIDHHTFSAGMIYLRFSANIYWPDWKDWSTDKTAIEMVSCKNSSYSVREFRVHYRALFFPFCCFWSSSWNKGKSRESIIVEAVGFRKAMFENMLFGLSGIVLAKGGALLGAEASWGYWMVSLYHIFLFSMYWTLMNMDSGNLFLSFHKIPFLFSKVFLS